MKFLKHFSFQQIPPRKIRLGCLMLIGILDAVAMSLGPAIYSDFSGRIVFYMNMLAMLYLGITISHPISRLAEKILLLGLLFCALPFLLQLRDFKFLTNIEHPLARFPNYTFLCSYVLCFSFAAVADEKDSATGLKLFNWCLVFASAIMTVLFFLFMSDRVPYELQNDIGMGMDDLRLYLIWNPNVTSRILMVGIGAACLLMYESRHLPVRILLFLSVLLFLIVISFTDSRTVIIILSVFLGGLIFLRIYKGNTNTLLFGILAAVLSALLLFVSIRGIYKGYWQQQTTGAATTVSESSDHSAAASAISEETSESDSKAVTAPKSSEIDKVTKARSSPRFILNLGGRVAIWEGIFKGLAKNPRFLLTGVRNTDIDEFIMEYSKNPRPHSHNSWLEVLLTFGILGLAFVIYLTWLALKNIFSLLFLKKSNLLQKSVCIFLLTMMGTEFLEPFLFLPNHPVDFMNLTFMLLLGYLIYWNQNAEPLKKTLPASKT